MTDIEIRDALLRGDEEVTMKFFFTECKPLFYNIIRRVFSYDVDYDECINEFYIHIMEDNGKRLRQFRGDRENSIFKWIMVVAIRYFIKNRNQVIDKFFTAGVIAVVILVLSAYVFKLYKKKKIFKNLRNFQET